MNLTPEKSRSRVRWCALIALAFLGTASADEIFPEDLSWWWPRNVGSAARVYECLSARSRDTRDSVIVWTDKSNKVVAFGSALEGGRIPAHAMALGHPGGPDARNPVRAAAAGHRVISNKRTHVLLLKEASFSCTPSTDD